MLYIIIFLGAFLRLFQLDKYPTGITDDELHFVLNAKAIYTTGHNLANNWSPLDLKTIPNEQSSELTHTIISPIIGPLPTNLFTARLPFAIFGILLILVIYRFILNITKNKQISLACAFIYSINPWAIYTSRTSFDGPVSLFFLFLGLMLATEKNKFKYLSPLSFILCFYTYIANKTLLLPVLTISYFAYFRFNQKKVFIACLTSILLVTTVFATTQLSTGNRTSELVSPSLQKFKDQVVNERNQSIQTPLTKLITNPYTVMGRFMLNKYLTSFDPRILFATGDNTYLVSLWRHGYFYYIDAIFLIIGIFNLSKQNKHFSYLLLSLILLAPLPSMIRKDDLAAIAFHSSLTFPSLSILAGTGLYYAFKKSRTLGYTSVLVYTLSASYMMYVYLFQYPIYQPDGFSYTNRQVSELTIKNQGRKISVITNQPETMFKNYIFYSNSYNTKTNLEISMAYKNRNQISFNDINFIDIAPEISDPNTIYIIEKSKYKDIYPNNGEVKKISDNQTTYILSGKNILR